MQYIIGVFVVLVVSLILLIGKLETERLKLIEAKKEVIVRAKEVESKAFIDKYKDIIKITKESNNEVPTTIGKHTIDLND